MATVNIKQLINELNTNSRPQLEALARGAAVSKFNGNKKEFIEKFTEHPYTEELKGGEEAGSVSLTKGNLFSALGFFKDNKNPVDGLTEDLKKIEIVKNNPSIEVIPSKLTFKYKYYIKGPTLQEIKEKNALTWVNRSWIDEIENGISELAFYVFSLKTKFKSPDPSRSSTGLQDERRKNITAATYTAPTRYFTEMFKEFLNNLKKF